MASSLDAPKSPVDGFMTAQPSEVPYLGAPKSGAGGGKSGV